MQVGKMNKSRVLFVAKAWALLLGCSLVAAAAETGTLVVHAQGLTSDDGNLRFVMFDSKENFLKRPVRAEVIEISGQQGTWIIEDLPFGEYAVLVHHDIDGSGKMERHWYGKPKEPTGASNNAPPRMGPPKYKDAKFQLGSSELTITITVN